MDRSSIKALEDEGLVYSTIDEEHYKSTGNAWSLYSQRREKGFKLRASFFLICYR